MHTRTAPPIDAAPPSGDRSPSQADGPGLVELSRSTSSRNWLTAPAIVLAAIVLVAHPVLANPFYTIPTTLCAGVQGAAVVLLITRYARTLPPRLPWVEVIALIHYVQFGLSVTVEPAPVGVFSILASAEAHEQAAVMALLGAIAMIVTFGCTRFALRGSLARNPIFPKLTPEIVGAACKSYVIIAGAYVLMMTFVPGTRDRIIAIANVTQALFGVGPLVVVPAVAHLTCPSQSTRFALFAALGVVLLSVASSSMLNDAVLPLAGLGLLWWRARGRLPLVPSVAAVAIMLIFQPVKSYYREYRWDPSSNVGVVEGWSHAFEMASADARSGYVKSDSGSEAARKRMTELSSAAYIFEIVPAAMPHGGGMIYTAFATSIVPRFLWPDKPNVTKIGLDETTIALNLTERETAEHSTTGITLTAQGYYEHGVVGSVGWMALLGVLLGGLVTYYGTSLSGTLAGAAVLTPWLVTLGSGFVGCFGGIWQGVAGSTALAWLIAWMGRRARAVAAPASSTAQNA